MTIGNDDVIRTFLADEARRAVAAAPSLDEALGRLAPRIGGRPTGAPQRLILLLAATLLLVAALGTALALGSGLLRLPPEEPAVDLGIFEPAAGGIVYYAESGLWAVDPNAPDPVSTLTRLDLEGTGDAEQFASFTVPLGWSSDGTKLLFMREDPTDQTFPPPRHLFILHADGTETQVAPEPVGGAAISSDGARVVFASDGGGLYVVDAEGGQPVRIADEGESPTFSPDGTQIAYLSESGQAGLEHVWVANADGTDAHEILTDEALAMGMGKLTWSPTGDRIAMEDQQEGHLAIYTFTPEGSDFTKVITGGFNHSWSPNGSQIAYGMPGRDGLYIADADGSNVRTLGAGAPGPWHPATFETLTGCSGISASGDVLTLGWCPIRPDGQQVRVASRLAVHTTLNPSQQPGSASASAWLNGEEHRSAVERC